MKENLLIGQGVILAVMLSCGHVREPVTSRRDSDPDLRTLARTVAGPPGYPLRSGPVFFNRENLYEAINGMAPEYISYGCVALGMLDWKPTDKAEEKVQAEIYDMGSPLGAFGIYSRAHTGDGAFCDVGEEAAVAEDSVEFSRGRYYVRLMGPMDSRPVLEDMARAIVARVPPGPRPEYFLQALPSDGRIARTERWMPEGAFGMDFLRNVWIARYRLGDKEVELFLASFGSEAAAEAAWTKFRESVKKHSPQPIGGEYPGFVYSDEWIGRVAVFRVGRRLAVIVGHETMVASRSLLRKIAFCKEAEG